MKKSTWLVIPTLAAASVFAGDLSNLSYRADLAAANDTFNIEFALSGGSGSRDILLRAVGPGLAPLGVSGYETDPRFNVYTGSSNVDNNDTWSSSLSSTFSSVGAFALPSGSLDAAKVFTATGAHRLEVIGTTASGRNVLAEFYDTAPSTSGRKLIKLSAENAIDEGSSAIGGFVIVGSTGAELLLRGVGPSLSGSNKMPDPILRLYNSAGTLIASNDNWQSVPAGYSSSPTDTDYASLSTEVSNSASALGASSLTSGSQDAAMLVWLKPGIYTTTLSHDSSGVGSNKNARLEIYKTANEKLGYDPNYWGTHLDLYLQSNNCYNYATNVRYDPVPYGGGFIPHAFAQPGRKGGLPVDGNQAPWQTFTGAQIRASLEADGLIYTDASSVAPAGWIKIACYRSTPDSQDKSAAFHFYRQDANGLWSHKNGGDAPSNLDASGNLITNPETANLGSQYPTFSGYYWVKPGTTVDPYP